MALNLETSFATVVHRSPPRARLETAFASVVHRSPPRARVETAFASVVHTAGGVTSTEYPVGQSAFRQPDLTGRFAFPFVPKIE
jgi:hypothetical protein